MGDTRIRYGLAYGRMNNFYTGVSGQKGYLAGTDGLFAQANTSPDVTTGVLFYTNNSGATTINNFTLSAPGNPGGNLAGLFEGKEIKIIFLDSNTTISGPSIYLSGPQVNFPQRSYISFLYHGSAWYEVDRSVPTSALKTVQIAGTNNALDANFTSSIIVTGTTVLQVVSGISGGYIGQVLTLISGSGGACITVTTAGNILMATTSAINMSVNSTSLAGAIQLVKSSSTQWSLISDGIGM